MARRSTVRIDDHKRVSHEIFARKDVVLPQVADLKRETLYIRKRMDQLAAKYNLPPVVITAVEEDELNGF